MEQKSFNISVKLNVFRFFGLPVWIKWTKLTDWDYHSQPSLVGYQKFGPKPKQLLGAKAPLERPQVA